jgi:hypothetical protein
MKRVALIMSVFALIVAACGDDDAATTSEATAAPTTAAATTAAPTTTAAPATTTTEAATTTAAMMSGPEAFVATFADYIGEYEGQWDNTTFGSTGAVSFNVMEANTGAGYVLFEVDADGSAFGGADPEPFIIEISVDGDNLYVGFSEFIGPSTFEIDEAGNFTLTAAPPSLGETLEIIGTITAAGFAGAYDIPGLAEGTFSAAPVG